MDSRAPNFEGFVVPETEGSSQIRIGNEQQGPSGSNNFYVPNNIPFQQSFPSNSNVLRSNMVYGDSSQMFNMSTPNPGMSSHNFPAFQPPLPYDRNIGNGGGGGGMNINGILGGGRGAFTSTQLMELQNQTYIYKYIAANVAVPPHLLTPLRNHLYPHLLPPSPAAFYSPPPLRWGNPRPACGSSNDPEPRRCRRTDGKKWRCAKDVVTNQRYCERHMNRGRQRTRRTTQLLQRSTSSSSSSSKNPNNIHSNSDLVLPNSSMDVSANRSSITSTNNVDGGEKDPQGVLAPVIEEQSIFPSDSFIDPNLNEQQEPDQTQFIDWPELKSDWTSSDYSFMPSSSTLLHDQRALSPLTLPQEIDPLQAGLAVNNEFDDLTQNPTNWMAFNHEINPSPPS